MKKIFKSHPEGEDVMIDLDQISTAKGFEEMCDDKGKNKLKKFTRVTMKDGSVEFCQEPVKKFMPVAKKVTSKE